MSGTINSKEQRGLWDILVNWLGGRSSDMEATPSDLAGAEATFSAIVNIASEAIITTDQDLRILNFNKGAEDIFGYTAADIVGRSLNELIPGRFRTGHDQHVRNFARSGVPARRMGERRQISGLRKNGEEFPAEASISQLQIGERKLFTVVLRDITERRRRELTQTLLAQASEMLAGSLDIDVTLKSVADLIVPHVADWCVVCVLQEDGSITREAIAHRDPTTQRKLHEAALHRPVTNPAHPVAQVVKTGETLVLGELTVENFVSMAEGAEHALILQEMGARCAIIVPMVARNETRGAIALFTNAERRPFDEDDVVLAEDLARRSALALDNARLYRKAQSAIAARDDVLAIVSHDLGNPLSAIRIGTTLLLSGLSEEEKQEGGWKHIVGIRNSAEQMERLIRDLLEVKRIEAGQLSVERDKVSITPLIGEAVELLSTIADGRDIKLRAIVAPDLPAVYADRERILQAFSNLVGNAVKFTPPGGTVTIAAEARADEVVLSVSDTGSGISPEDLPHVFDRYWQAKARRRGRQGIGLGLVIVKGIIEAHGGKVWAESAIGQGSRFSFSLPLWSDAYERLDE
ncbi:MAG TPA: ATP-binding protein [Longimicrobiales bacterium]